MKAFCFRRSGSHRYWNCAIAGILLLRAFLPAAYSEGPTFEAASLRAAKPPEMGRAWIMGCNGGPGTKDPGRWTCENSSLQSLVSNAFDLKPYQIQGLSPDSRDQFEISAKIPEGATKNQFRQMQQNLLVERLGLKFHFEKKEIQGYEIITTKNGPKFKEYKPEPPKDPEANPSPSSKLPSPLILIGKDGSATLPPIPPGVTGVTITLYGARGQWICTTMEKMAEFISEQVKQPAIDATRLTGKYDISLDWAPEQIGNIVPQPLSPNDGLPSAPAPSGPNIFTALQEQLGLKLVPKKVTIEMLIVDHIEKTPTEN